ncbi:NADPH-dependent 7-cyano-7-deazaguanine reductase QueF [Glaciecola petra]|uniref:NADPH-dependent 7-cyano-7-deazaguanine reductase n=1 Tax=Glaciecola petra TaxID=3075602 RepID=A0ABU2ZM40_9ALTE|nr:NADPH-dependent 7-cyano-7-deazaguanine reductase QueF [Aestuariibacter sp. P117]MDT0593683.1 NADPH-dependent 7-cyano-7-deazaguanine reductase QueF [Aestuariibacter sp. P117]
MENLSLGKATSYTDQYDASLLQGVPRRLSREQIGLSTPLPFTGSDIWNAYEVSWLNLKGKPVVAILRCWVPIDSPNLIESKSFKLYLNSFNQSKFKCADTVSTVLEKDLSECAGNKVAIKLMMAEDFDQQVISDLKGDLLDTLDITMDEYSLEPSQLQTSEKEVSETLVSHLLKSNCLITNQPDWGSILIRYSGKQIDRSSLLKYIISFRQHNEFHEQCVERIFMDIQEYCKPEKLSVYARYTRRGGLDINPFRSNFEATYSDIRLARQ